MEAVTLFVYSFPFLLCHLSWQERWRVQKIRERIRVLISFFQRHVVKETFSGAKHPEAMSDLWIAQ